ncbi:Pyridoxamine 5'-phosphate oxidase [Minicystis rosea]|nr:Pyridoxamine 5'-phosphate oxidase [Minicystis rosea]
MVARRLYTAPRMSTADPIALFLEAFAKAKATEPHDATAMTLATADARGRPSARMVLLKSADARGFTFFTNFGSRKAQELAENPYAALCIHWPASQQQVRVEGRVERATDAEADAYFATRPRESQIGAWASKQSAPLASREALEAEARAVNDRFPGPVPRPPFWGGYRLVPDRIELWHAGPGRLHDRFVYTRAGDGWTMERLNP